MQNNSNKNHQRRETREVFIGTVPLGGNNPIRIQSMTNTNPFDVESTFKQIVLLKEANCDYVRLTVPSSNTIKAIEKIKKKLDHEKINFPLIADIHFNPQIALECVDLFDKIRINPGNFSENPKHAASLETIRSNFHPLLAKLKNQNKALRIGVNHGSLSKRILNKYGNTTKAMVESALEYILLAQELEFHNIILSMKSSIPQVMIESYLNLVSEMERLKMNYPLHLGVTEAGDGQTGRIKSSAGIGTLLFQGLGDTIRVSLSEPPENEIPAASSIIKRLTFHSSFNHEQISNADLRLSFNKSPHPPLIGIISESKTNQFFDADFMIDENFSNITFASPHESFNIDNITYFLDGSSPFTIIDADHTDHHTLEIIKPSQILIMKAQFKNFYSSMRNCLKSLKNLNKNNPVIFYYENFDSQKLDHLIFTSMDLTSLCFEHPPLGLIIHSNHKIEEQIDILKDILQATRLKLTKTEFISCPTCGRTQFDLMNSLKQVKQKTSHLPGLKIAVMGCIVNGPGEMADADYGYIGLGQNKVSLYRGQSKIFSGIDQTEALDKLIELIKEDNRWIEP